MAHAARAALRGGSGAATSPARALSGIRVTASSVHSRREALLGFAAAAAVGGGAASPGPSSLAHTATGQCSIATGAAPPSTADADLAVSTSTPPPPTELDRFGVQRLALKPEGWNTWQWRGHRVNWLSMGDSGPAVVLIHGFGASAYHFRYNVPELAKSCRVYAMDLLGFGWSDKPLVDYQSYTLWADQIADFVREVVGEGEPVTLVGNSLGGYNVVACAAEHPELVQGVVLLNAAGRFEADSPELLAAQQQAAAAAEAEAEAKTESGLARMWADMVAGMRRAAVTGSFYLTKQPARIKQVLNSVYVSSSNIDDDLIRSIALAAEDPNAPEVFFRIITGRGQPMNRLFDRLAAHRTPVLLLWGEADPWCVPARATQIQRFYPLAQRIDLPSGHCPHDDTPALVNAELLRWVQRQV